MLSHFIMLHLPVLRWGQPYTSMDNDQVVHFSERRADREGRPRQRRPDSTRHAQGGACARRPARDPHPGARSTASAKAGELYANAELPMGDGSQTPDEFVRAQSGIDRHPRAAVPREHEEEHLRARRDAADPRVADARPRSRRAVARLRRGARRPDQLPGREPGARSGAAVEFARRAHAVAAGHPDADRPRPQARSAGAVDAVPHGRGVLRRRASRAKRSRSTPARATSAPRSSTDAAAA